jgi:GT2 family glycosyltransferase
MNADYHGTSEPLLEIIACQVVTYNSERTIHACLQSLNRISVKNRSVIFVLIDNASTDRTREIIEQEREHFDRTLIVHYEDKNLGFSGGHNKALSISREKGASYITLINPDLCLDSDAISHMRNAFDCGYKIGAVCPRLYRTDEDFSVTDPACLTLDSCGMIFESSFRHFDRGSGLPSETAQGRHFPHPEYVSGSSGACVMYSMQCIDDTTLPRETNETIPKDRTEFLDEDFFAYREDAELSLRMKWLGWRIRYEPRAEGFHVRKVLPERRNLLPAEINALGVKNRFLMQIQTLPVLAFLLLCPMILFRNLLVITACLFKERSSLPAFRKLASLFPRTIKKRRWVLSKKRTSLLSFISLFYRGNSADPALALKKEVPLELQIPSLHISIVSYNQSEDILHNLPVLLESLREIPDWHVTITSNAPEDTQFYVLKEHFHHHAGISFHCPDDNLGFARANNAAFESSTAEIYLLLNPDIHCTPEALRTILAATQKYSNIGAISPVLIDEDTRNIQFRYLAKKLPRITTLFQNLFFLDTLLPSNSLSLHDSFQDDPLLLALLEKQSSTLYEIEQAAGACLFIPSGVYKSLGGLDASYYPAWFEDVDFARKLRNAGLVSAIHTGVSVLHKGGTSEHSIGRGRLLKYFYKNMSVYWKQGANNQIRYSLILGLIFLCFFSRRLSVYAGDKISGKSTDSLKQLLYDVRYFFS